MKRSLGITVVAILFSLSQSAFAQYDDKALEILDDMSSKYKSIPAYEATFTQTLENAQANINEDFSGQITVKGEKFRLSMGGQEIINDGKTVWTYIPEVNEVNIDNYNPQEGEMTPSKVYAAYKEGYKYIYLEEKKIGPKSYDVVDLVPEDKNDPFFKIRLVIDQKGNILKSWTMFDKSGNKYIYDITDFKILDNIKDTFFKFDKDKYNGVEVVDLR